MIPEHAKAMAEYNQWMNQKIYDVCAQMSKGDLKQNRNAFFKSIHGTLNHILLADKVWFGRFLVEPFKANSLDQVLHESFLDLRNEREEVDQRVLEWANGLTSEKLNSQFRFTSMLSPLPRTCQLWAAVTHFFNHQTHHRGQITTLLTQCGLDVGVTDLIAMPGMVTLTKL